MKIMNIVKMNEMRIKTDSCGCIVKVYFLEKNDSSAIANLIFCRSFNTQVIHLLKLRALMKLLSELGMYNRNF